MIKRSLSAFEVKLLAMIAMTADHVAWAFVSTQTLLAEWLHFVGRLVAPLMAYFVVVGFYHTQHLKDYATRLGVFAIISQPVYMAYQVVVFGNDVWAYLWQGNVLFGLLLALMVLWLRHLAIHTGLKWALILVMFWGAGVADYGRALVLWALLFGAFYERGFERRDWRTKSVLLMAYALSLPLAYVAIYGFRQTVGLGFMHFGMLLIIPLIFMYDGTRGKDFGGRYVFYVFYPLHLALLAGLKYLSLHWGMLNFGGMVFLSLKTMTA